MSGPWTELPVELCRLCGHGEAKHHRDLTRPRCDSCPAGLCADGPDGQRYRAMIGVPVAGARPCPNVLNIKTPARDRGTGRAGGVSPHNRRS